MFNICRGKKRLELTSNPVQCNVVNSSRISLLFFTKDICFHLKSQKTKHRHLILAEIENVGTLKLSILTGRHTPQRQIRRQRQNVKTPMGLPMSRRYLTRPDPALVSD